MYLKFAKRLHLKYSQHTHIHKRTHTKVSIWGERCVNLIVVIISLCINQIRTLYTLNIWQYYLSQLHLSKRGRKIKFLSCTSHIWLLNTYTWLVAAGDDSADIHHFHHFKKLYWTVCYYRKLDEYQLWSRHWMIFVSSIFD